LLGSSMEPDWLKSGTDDNFYTATFQSHDLSAFVTMFANVTYLVSRGSRVGKAGNVGDLETAKAEAFRLAQELET
jgi:hypothetical protein